MQQQANKSDAFFIVMMGLMAMLTPLAIDMYLPSFSVIAADLAVSQESIQNTLSLFTLGFAIGQLIWGPISDSYGRKKVILFGTLVSGVASFFITQVNSLHWFYILRIIQGFFGAAPAVVSGALLRDLFQKEEFVKMMSMIMIVSMVAPLLAPIIGGQLTFYFHWRSIFYLLMGLAFVCLLLVYFKIPETLPKAKRISLSISSVLRNYKQIFVNKVVMCYILCNSFSFAGMFCFVSSGSTVYGKIFGVQPENFGYFFFSNIVVLMIATAINGRLVTTIGADTSLKIGLLVQLVAGGWLLLSGIFHLGLWATAAGVSLFVGMVSTIASNANAAVLECHPRTAGTANALMGMIRFGTGSLVGVILALFPVSSERPMLFAMALCVVLAYVFYLLIPQK